jgi:Mn-dependent DtxR family transcriptional regulator
MLYRCGETGRNALFRSQLLAAAGGGAAARCALRSLSRRGLVAFSPQGETTLTDRGRVDASSLVRSHRLWESYLKKHLGLPEDHLHSPAERMEHFVSKDLQTRIASDIADSADPHGKQIPPGAAS